MKNSIQVQSIIQYYISNMSYVQFFLKKTSVLLLLSRSVMSDSLLHHRLQHTWLPCLSLSPRVCSNLGPLSQWCHPTISSSAITFSPVLNLSWHQGLFQWVSSSHLGGQSIGTAPQVLPMNIQGWFPLGLTGLRENFVFVFIYLKFKNKIKLKLKKNSTYKH